MAFTPNKKTANDFNGGVEYKNGDGVQAETINNLVEGVLYAQENGGGSGGTANTGNIKFNENTIYVENGEIVLDNAVNVDGAINCTDNIHAAKLDAPEINITTFAEIEEATINGFTFSDSKISRQDGEPITFGQNDVVIGSEGDGYSLTVYGDTYLNFADVNGLLVNNDATVAGNLVVNGPINGLVIQNASNSGIILSNQEERLNINGTTCIDILQVDGRASFNDEIVVNGHVDINQLVIWYDELGEYVANAVVLQLPADILFVDGNLEVNGEITAISAYIGGLNVSTDEDNSQILIATDAPVYIDESVEINGNCTITTAPYEDNHAVRLVDLQNAIAGIGGSGGGNNIVLVDIEQMITTQDIAKFNEIFGYVKNGEKVVVGSIDGGKSFAYITNGQIVDNGHKFITCVAVDAKYDAGVANISARLEYLLYFDGENLLFTGNSTAPLPSAWGTINAGKVIGITEDGYEAVEVVTKEDLGDIDTALNSILAIQNKLIGGNS